ncbi:hypothetical protein [Kibdelosporangium philippinense]
MTGARACLPLRHGVLNARAAHGGEQAAGGESSSLTRRAGGADTR